MMKIVIKKHGRKKTILLPNFLITTFGKDRMIKWLKNKYDLDLDYSQLKQFAKTLNQFKKQFNLPLVEMVSEDSEVTLYW